jgi:hypothetical protein
MSEGGRAGISAWRCGNHGRLAGEAGAEHGDKGGDATVPTCGDGNVEMNGWGVVEGDDGRWGTGG